MELVEVLVSAIKAYDPVYRAYLGGGAKVSNDYGQNPSGYSHSGPVKISTYSYHDIRAAHATMKGTDRCNDHRKL
jgi:hypothetical protein